MEITTLVPVLLPVVLFIITLIIIIAMREQDSRKRGIASVRKLTDQLKAEISDKESEFRSEVAELETKIAQKDSEIEGFFLDITRQLKEIEAYSTDLAKMRAAMETYRDALCGLAKLTQDADSKITQVEEEVDRLETIHKTIEGFKLDMKDADEHLKQHEGLVIQMERDTMSRLEDRCKSLSSDFSLKIDRLCDQLDIKIEATRDATESLLNQGAEVLGNIGDRTAEQVQLASQVRELNRQKERLIDNINVLNRKVEEKKAMNLELDAIARNEARVYAENYDEPVQEPVQPVKAVEPEQKVAEQIIVPEETKVVDEAEPAPVIEIQPEPEEVITELQKEEQPVPESHPAEQNIPDYTMLDYSDIKDTEVPFSAPSDDGENDKIEYYGEEEEIVFD